MTTFINTSTMEFPVTEWQIKSRFPNTSFGFPFSPPEPYAAVVHTAKPVINEVTHHLEEGIPIFSNGEWQQTWDQVAYDAPTAAARQTAADAELRRQITDAVMRMMDEFVATRNYSSMLSCVSYAQSTNPQFAAEAAYAIAWRDDVWENCYQILSAVQNNLRPIPTVEQVLSELSAPTWPA